MHKELLLLKINILNYRLFKQIILKSVSTLPPLSTINIFDRNNKLLQRERAAKALDVNVYDYIKDEVGCRLSDRIYDIKKTFKKGLNLGCGRGHVSKRISQESLTEIILTDLSPTWLIQAETSKGIKVEKKVIDEEEFDLEPNSLDIIISCLSLHWVNDLPKCFSCIINSLKDDGVFMAAVFGGDTLFELRSALQLAELEREGGIAAHISPFTQIRDIGSLMTKAGFSMLTIDTDEIIIGYPSMFELMWDLKGMGENNAARNRKLLLKRDILFSASAIYNQLYSKNNKEDGTKYIPATFQIIYMLGWKPDESQPKAIKRGSGEISLKDIYKIDDIIKNKGKNK